MGLGSYTFKNLQLLQPLVTGLTFLHYPATSMPKILRSLQVYLDMYLDMHLTRAGGAGPIARAMARQIFETFQDI